MGNYNRKKYLTNRKYQLKYTLVIVLAILITAVVLGGLTYWEIAVESSKEQVSGTINWTTYIIRVILLSGGAFLVGIFLSHKVIGPIEKIETGLKKIRRGNFDVKLILRDKDEFLDIAREINRIAEKLDKYSQKDNQFRQKFKE